MTATVNPNRSLIFVASTNSDCFNCIGTCRWVQTALLRPLATFLTSAENCDKCGSNRYFNSSLTRHFGSSPMLPPIWITNEVVELAVICRTWLGFDTAPDDQFSDRKVTMFLIANNGTSGNASRLWSSVELVREGLPLPIVRLENFRNSVCNSVSFGAFTPSKAECVYGYCDVWLWALLNFLPSKSKLATL